jgi:hypothetical protein
MWFNQVSLNKVIYEYNGVSHLEISEAVSRRAANDLTTEADDNTEASVQVLELQSWQR